jgi:O-antigen/teichoic acid export membrane protein
MIPMAGAYVFGTLLTANGSLKQLNIIALIGVVFSFGLNFILIPEMGAYGAAVTCLTTQMIAFTLQFFVAVRLFNFMPNRNLPFLIGPLAVLIVLGSATADLDWQTASIVVLVTGGVLTLISLIPDYKTLLSLRSQ